MYTKSSECEFSVCWNTNESLILRGDRWTMTEKDKERLMTSLTLVLNYLKVDGCKGIIFEK